VPPSVFAEASVSPSFLRPTLVKKPRTECDCQPVDSMMVAIVAPPAGAAAQGPAPAWNSLASRDQEQPMGARNLPFQN
jgi:hypothetical protein